MTAADRSDVEHFVRQTLGCTCPDEAFASLAIRRVAAVDDLPAMTRLVVGNRLLIYIVGIGDLDARPDAIHALARSGRSDRDEQQLNRFRLVVAFDRNARTSAGLQEQFESSAGGDARAHLHLVTEEALPVCFRARRTPL